MDENHIRHLPVINSDGKLAGMLSVRSLLHEKVQELTDQLDSLEAYFTADGAGGSSYRFGKFRDRSLNCFLWKQTDQNILEGLFPKESNLSVLSLISPSPFCDRRYRLFLWLKKSIEMGYIDLLDFSTDNQP